MNKNDTEKNALFLKTVRKYAPALCTCLYPSQTRELKSALREYQSGYIPYISDPFVNLAYEMIISDISWQEYEKAVEKGH